MLSFKHSANLPALHHNHQLFTTLYLTKHPRNSRERVLKIGG